MFQKKRNTFHGGVHPYEGKELSKDKPIVKAQPGNLLYYAVSQHIGAPAVPTVKKGDHVKAGQKIAEAGGFVSAPVYASVSGMVKGIEKKVSAAGSPVDCIVVENDGLYEKETFEECPHWEKLDADKLQNLNVILRKHQLTELRDTVRFVVFNADDSLCPREHMQHDF